MTSRSYLFFKFSGLVSPRILFLFFISAVDAVFLLKQGFADETDFLFSGEEKVEAFEMFVVSHQGTSLLLHR